MTDNKTAQLLLVERTLRQGLLESAFKRMDKYEITEVSTEAFVACGDFCIANKRKWGASRAYGDALIAYKNAAATWKLIELGDLCMQVKTDRDTRLEDMLPLAFQAYAAASAGLKLIALAEVALEHEKEKLAYDCYEAVADRAGLMKVAQQAKDVQIVIKAYAKADARQELIDTGLRLIEKFYATEEGQQTTNLISYAKSAFQAAGAVENLVRCADAYLALALRPEYGSQAIGWVIECYQLAKAPLPEEKLLSIVDHYVSKEDIAERICTALCDAGIKPVTLL